MAVLEARMGVNIEPDLFLPSVMIRRGACLIEAGVEAVIEGVAGKPAAFNPIFTVGGDLDWFDSIGWAIDRAGPLPSTRTAGMVDDGVPLCVAYEFDQGPEVASSGGGDGGPVPDPGDLTLLFDNRLI